MSAAGQAVAPCWNCEQVVQATATTCLWCGVAVQPSVTPIVVAPGGAAPAPVASPASPAAPAPGAPPQQFSPAPAGHAPYTPPPRTPKPEPVPLNSAIAGTSAGVGAQVGAFTIDLLAVAAVTATVHLTVASTLITALTLIQALVFLWVLEARSGLTVGHLLLRIRSSKAATPYSPGAGRAFVRQTLLHAGLLVAVAGAWVVAASGAWDSSGRRRSLAARASGTLAVKPLRKTRSTQRASAPVAPQAPGAPPATAPGGGLVAPRVVSTSTLGSASIEDSRSGAVTGPPSQSSADSAPQLVTSLDPAAPAHDHSAADQGVVGNQHIAPVPGMVQPQPPAEYSTGHAPGVDSSAPTDYGAPAEQDQPAPPTSSAATPAAPATPEPSAQGAALLLVFDTGQRATVAVGTAINLGRKPAPVEATDQLVAVEDPEGTVSKFHARLEHSRGQTWVTDQGSTNGTDILDDEGATRLEPGVRTLIEDGMRTRLGNRSFTVSVLLDPTPSPESST